jgi:hypothetical protein
MTDDQLALLERFKHEHPPGSWVSAVVKARGPVGVYFDLGVPFYAFLDRLFMNRPEGRAPAWPEGFPAVGERMDVRILRYSKVAEDVPFICLTQGPMSLRELPGSGD